ncbi:TPA: polysaccharide biosynthesis protein [Neisseria meningitidis]
MTLETLLALPRNIKKICFLIHDFLMIFTAFWFTQSLKADYSNEWFDPANWQSFLLTALLTIGLFVRMGLYRAVTRFVSFHVLTTAFAGSLVSAVLFFLNTLIFEEKLRLALPVVYFLLLLVSVTGSRMVIRGLLSDHQKKHMTPVIIYGAGGSIGSELCRQIIRRRPEKLLLFELSEFALYAIEKELRETCIQKRLDTEILPFLGSVQNRTLLEHVMTAFSVATVYHAAAYKHVPMVEFNTVEGIRNNIFGTLECALAATASGVRTFVLISTDKAVRPTNTMGASKRMAELCLQALAAEPGQKTRFSMVRFGNVLGSSGSVVPLFEKQIAEGGPITLTHPEITRYFMTIPEAAQLVIQAGAMGTGGDVFVLDMGESVKIIDLARQMITLSGLKPKTPEQPDGDIEILITGLRPGEKLYEELLIGDNVRKTGHPRIMTANETMLPWHELSALLDRIRAACDRYDQQAIRTLLINAPTGFAPSDGICDLLWVRETHRKNAV